MSSRRRFLKLTASATVGGLLVSETATANSPLQTDPFEPGPAEQFDRDRIPLRAARNLVAGTATVREDTEPLSGGFLVLKESKLFGRTQVVAPISLPDGPATLSVSLRVGHPDEAMAIVDQRDVVRVKPTTEDVQEVTFKLPGVSRTLAPTEVVEVSIDVVEGVANIHHESGELETEVTFSGEGPQRLGLESEGTGGISMHYSGTV